MRKNTAGQVVAFQAVSTTDGSAVTTGTPAVYYTIDGGTQGTGAGTSTHEGNGCWSYVPAQAETNGNHVVFTFVLTGAVSQSVNLYPVSFDPTDSVRIGLTALPDAAAGAAGGLPTDSTGKTSFNDLDAAGVRTAVGMASANLDTQLADLPTVAEFEARTLAAAAYFDPAADVVANVTTVGSVTGSVGSISGVSFPANFGSLLINVSGHVSRVVLVDTTTTNTDMRGTDSAALASQWTATRAGYLDGVLLADNFNQRVVAVTGSKHVAADVHEFQTGVLTSDATAASFVTEVQAGLATAANQTTILNRLGSWTGTGLNTILGAFRAIAGKAASLTPSDISSGTTYDNTTDSLEAIRDRGDAAWAPGEAGSGDASQSTLLDVQDQVEAIAAALGGSAVSVTNRVADGGAMVLYTGDDMRVRSGTSITVAISDAAGGIYTRLSGIGAANLAWGAARQSQAPGAISGTISSVTQSGSGADQVVNLVIEINDAGQSLNPADDYVWQVVSTSSDDDEYTEIEGTLDLRRRVAVPV